MLLLDENLSPRLVARICGLFPDCQHVLHAKLDNSPDIDIWNYARANQLTIVTKDKDFLTYASQHGMPPKVLYIESGNTRIALIEKVIRDNEALIRDFIEHSRQGVMKIG